MKVAVIGSGISGLAAAYLAHQNGEEVHLFEKGSYFGGHSNSILINDGLSEFYADTGFLVHNPRTYPNFIELLKVLEVATVESQMTLSIQIIDRNIEWGGTNLGTLFAQKTNLLRPSFHRMVRDILRFNKQAPIFLQQTKLNTKMTLAALLDEHQFSKELRDWYLIPMAAAIWSTPANKIVDFPAFTFLQFCLNHNLLQVDGRPQWRTIAGGSREYVRRMVDRISSKHLNCQIESVSRLNGKVQIIFSDSIQTFDQVIFATHADQTMKLLSDLQEDEQELLAKFQFQKNIALVHSDSRLLPRRKKLWSAWNYASSPRTDQVSVSYFLNHLQKLPTQMPVVVTLNPHMEVASERILRRIEYTHPIFDSGAVEAQKRISQIQGRGGIFHCGAWQGYGFHEDGLKSALKIAKIKNWKVPWSPIYE